MTTAQKNVGRYIRSIERKLATATDPERLAILKSRLARKRAALAKLKAD